MELNLKFVRGKFWYWKTLENIKPIDISLQGFKKLNFQLTLWNELKKIGIKNIRFINLDNYVNENVWDYYQFTAKHKFIHL